VEQNLQDYYETAENVRLAKEKQGLRCLQVIVGGILLFTVGIQVGKWSMVLFKYLGF
jgi:hypothetical protein